MSGSGIGESSLAARAVFWIGGAALLASFAIGAAVSWSDLGAVPFGSLGYLQTIRDLRLAGSEDAAVRELRADQRINVQDIRSSIMLSNVLAAHGDREAAVDALEFAGRHSFDPTVQLRLASALVELGRLDEADLALARALVLTPDRLDVLIGVGRIQQASGRMDLARATYLQALERDPSSTEARRALVEAGGGP